MWHIIKAEIENTKYAWLFLCGSLLLSALILLFIGEFESKRDQLLLQIIINLAKGFAIILVLLIMRSMLGYLAKEQLSAYHFKLPVSLKQMGIVRICNVFALWPCVSVLVLINLVLLPNHLTLKTIPIVLFGIGTSLVLFGLLIILMDTLSHWQKFTAYRHLAALLLAFSMISILFSQQTHIAHAITSTNIILVNLAGLILLILSIYTLSFRKSFLFKPEQ